MKTNEPEAIRSELQNLINNFEQELKKEDLRQKVLSLVQVLHNQWVNRERNVSGR